MPLTLRNSLTERVAALTSVTEARTSTLSDSLATGNNKSVSPVDGFIGGGLENSQIILGAIAKNTAYSTNVLTTATEYLSTINSNLQQGLQTLGAAGPLSNDKLAVLQKTLTDTSDFIKFIVRTADFDGKALLSGGATDIKTRIGLSISDTITLRVSDLSNGKIFRVGAANAINDFLTGALGRMADPNYQTQAAIDLATAQRVNFAALPAAQVTNAQLQAAISAVAPGNASFLRIDNGNLAPDLKVQIAVALNARLDAAITAAAGGGAIAAALGGGRNAAGLSAAVQAVVTAAGATTSIDTTALANAIEAAANTYLAAAGAAQASAAAAAVKTIYTGLAAGGNGLGLTNAAAADLLAALNAAGGGAGAAARAQLQNTTLADNQAINLTTPEGRELASDLYNTASNLIQALKANLNTQQTNISGAVDALRATINVTQRAADSYLKTDYVLTAQEYAEELRRIIAAVTSLQAANKIPEVAQRLIDDLAR